MHMTATSLSVINFDSTSWMKHRYHSFERSTFDSAYVHTEVLRNDDRDFLSKHLTFSRDNVCVCELLIQLIHNIAVVGLK